MEESSAKVLSFSSKEATEALVKYAREKGIDVPAYSGWEVKVIPNVDRVHCILFECGEKAVPILRTRGDA